MINKINKQFGFSLLELLLVVAVLAAISVSGVSYLREKAVNAKVDKAAVQMQQWLEASMAYYIKNQKWPEDKFQLLPDPQDPARHPYYLPAGSDRSPWYKGPGVGEYNVSPQEPDKTFVMVTATIPLAADGSNIARRLASKLPIAEAKRNTVTAYANIPGQGGGQVGGDVIIKGIYILPIGKEHDTSLPCTGITPPSSTDIPIPKCPSVNYDAKIYLSVQGYSTPIPELDEPFVVSTPKDVDTRYIETPDGKSWRASIIARGLRSDFSFVCSYKGTVIAMTACVKKQK